MLSPSFLRSVLYQKFRLSLSNAKILLAHHSVHELSFLSALLHRHIYTIRNSQTLSDLKQLSVYRKIFFYSVRLSTTLFLPMQLPFLKPYPLLMDGPVLRVLSMRQSSDLTKQAS